jgi:hypothetical protein
MSVRLSRNKATLTGHIFPEISYLKLTANFVDAVHIFRTFPHVSYSLLQSTSSFSYSYIKQFYMEVKINIFL